jgi:hypothetical protein
LLKRLLGRAISRTVVTDVQASTSGNQGCRDQYHAGAELSHRDPW